MMKKLILLALALSVLALAFVGCNGAPSHFSGEYTFSKISKVELGPEVSDETLDALKEHYGVDDKAGVEAALLDFYASDSAFNSCYVKFDKKNTYTYDPIFEREATWVFFQTGDNEGFLSFYTEIDPADVTPDPLVFPPVVYNAENGILTLTIMLTNDCVFTLEFTK